MPPQSTDPRPSWGLDWLKQGKHCLCWPYQSVPDGDRQRAICSLQGIYAAGTRDSAVFRLLCNGVTHPHSQLLLLCECKREEVQC